MTEFLELHDSSVDVIRVEGDVVVLDMRAYVHRSGASGTERETGWIQRGELVISGSRIIEQPDAGRLDISDGRIRAGDVLFENLVHLPLERSGEVLLRFMGAEGTLDVTGTAIRWLPRGEAEFVEETGFTVNDLR